MALVCDVYCAFVTFHCGILGQVWYLIVSFPDICHLPYLDRFKDGFLPIAVEMYIITGLYMPGTRGGRGPSPEKNTKIGFFSNTGPDSLKNTKLPSKLSMMGQHSMMDQPELGSITSKCNRLQLLWNFMITDYNCNYFF